MRSLKIAIGTLYLDDTRVYKSCRFEGESSPVEAEEGLIGGTYTKVLFSAVQEQVSTNAPRWYAVVSNAILFGCFCFCESVGVLSFFEIFLMY